MTDPKNLGWKKMKIAVFGATGGLGTQFLTQALEKGHSIIAYVRSPEKITIKHANLTVIKGDVFDKDKIAESIKGCNAALISWRMRSQRIPLFSEGTQNVIDAMKDNNLHRLIVMSEYAYGEHYRNFRFFTRGLLKLFGLIMKFQQKERRLQDEAVYNSGLDWTFSRIRGMTENGKATTLELTFEPKSKIAMIPYSLGAEKVLNQFEEPEQYIKKNVYF